VVAIGECGLDYYRPTTVDEELKRKQQAVLRDQIALAAELDKPLIIHSRPSKKTQDAYQDLITILQEAKREHSSLRGDIHFFVGGIPEMQALTALGFTVSFTAVITFAREYDSVIRAVPPHALLAETDAPYVPPTSREKGSRNDPLAVEDVVEKLAEIRGEELETLRERTLANSRRLFGLT
jgi:TatD DNase family protein